MLVLVLPAVCCTSKSAAFEPAGGGGDRLEIYRRNHLKLHDNFAKSLSKLAEFCDEKGFSADAQRIRELAVWRDDDTFRLESLPKEVQPDIPADLTGDERYIRTQLRHEQSEYAKDLYLLSRRVLHAGYPSYGYSLVREVAFHDPDHASARKLLGYVRYKDEWVTPFAARMLRNHNVWHDEFGWIPSTSVERYEAGERFFNRRWMTAAKEAELRRDFRNAWRVRSDHYLVKTNFSLKRGIELSQALENFYQIFFETFAGFFNSPEQMQKIFEGSGADTRFQRNPLVVHYYATRGEYVKTLEGQYPEIGMTNAMYLTAPRVSFTYHNPESTDDTALFHEATHQLFYESETVQRLIAPKQNFWIVEGIACYMESYQQDDGRFQLGDPNYIRFVAARHRFLVDGYYVPLAKFASMGMQEFQSDPNISKNYSQASGLVHFFMHYDGGVYREALIQHLSQIYSPNSRIRDKVAGLDALTGVSYEELDRQYGQYTKKLQASLERGRHDSSPKAAPVSQRRGPLDSIPEANAATP